MQMLTDLLPYQKDAVAKLSRLKVGALYMEQGTGKTRTTLSLIKPRLDAGKIEAVLWLCPCSVKKNLREDIAYHCGEFPREILIFGIESLSSSDRLYMKLLDLVTTNKIFIVVDESNLIKNKSAIRTVRITELAKHCPYRLILNGTPISKNEADLFAQWYVLDWRILGYQSYYSFAANHLEYWTVRMPDGTEVVDRGRIKRVLNVDYLSEKIAPYTYQIKKDECLKLPRKLYRQAGFRMTEAQEQIYGDIRNEYLLDVDELRDDTIYKFFAALQHVSSGRAVLTPPTQKMATEPIFKDPQDNPRIQALVSEIRNVGTDKCIVFCKYQSEIDDIERVLGDLGYSTAVFTGKLSQKRRQESRERFRGPVQILLANKACGAYGLNLQFCHRIIFYNNDFDLATRLQAEDRVHRIGQTHEVRIVDICAGNTIDTFITDCLLRKENLAEAFRREVALRKGKGKPMEKKLIIGLDDKDKPNEIKKYLAENPDVKEIVYFFPTGMAPQDLSWTGLPVEYRAFWDVIRYMFDTPLHEKVDNSVLLIYDEMLRVKKRNDLSYNACHHIANQTNHVLLFQMIPIIDQIEDFMILVDFIFPWKYKLQSYDDSFLDLPEVEIHRRSYFMDVETVPISDEDREAYETKKKDLFDNLGKKSPSTLPQNLQLFAGNLKKKAVTDGRFYLARNRRVKTAHVWKDYRLFDSMTQCAGSGLSPHYGKVIEAPKIDEAWVIDTPISRVSIPDFLRLSGAIKLHYMTTGLPVDNYYQQELQNFFDALDRIYSKGVV